MPSIELNKNEILALYNAMMKLDADHPGKIERIEIESIDTGIGDKLLVHGQYFDGGWRRFPRAIDISDYGSW